ncbi:ribosomal protein S18-alanine N-acetyltransferase [Wohlfahrtiimonas larvae]|uniref:[Ribosomal protein bS18]-alanine N-acetyltransferase n=1 Tax=Wohlfahrtiimonas larvae TaxID=1157986 RepID=A0ABP9MWJ6_9GAMM|nr:ribosomal protein S18-alanine N-acetyltransferase [Wohlfahrtiimonas larvae]
MNEISFLEITSDDFDVIYEIELKAYPIPWSEKIMRSMVEGHEYKIKITYYDKVIAYVFVMVVLDEATILNIAVDPDYQGQGIGQKLLRYLKAQLSQKGIRSIFLEVRQSNQNALALYTSEGFHEIDIRKNYYPAKNGREDAIIMACVLMNE